MIAVIIVHNVQLIQINAQNAQQGQSLYHQLVLLHAQVVTQQQLIQMENVFNVQLVVKHA
jgi:hypothetical protein